SDPDPHGALSVYSSPRAPPDLHSFPTRRSSDLEDLGDELAVVLRRTRHRVVVRTVVVGVHERRGEEELRQPVAVEEQVGGDGTRSEEHTSELQSRENLVCRLLLEKKKKKSKD